MGPDHDALAPARPPQPQRLAPYLLFLLGHAVKLALLLLLSALDVLVLSGRPLLFSALVEELAAGLLKCRYREESELVVLGHLDGGARNHHWRNCLVAAKKVFARIGRDGDQVGLEVLGILHEQAGIDDGDEGFCGEVSAGAWRGVLAARTLSCFGRGRRGGRGGAPTSVSSAERRDWP